MTFFLNVALNLILERHSSSGIEAAYGKTFLKLDILQCTWKYSSNSKRGLVSDKLVITRLHTGFAALCQTLLESA